MVNPSRPVEAQDVFGGTGVQLLMTRSFLIDKATAAGFATVLRVVEEIAIARRDQQVRIGRPISAKIEDVARVDVSGVATDCRGISPGRGVNLTVVESGVTGNCPSRGNNRTASSRRGGVC